MDISQIVAALTALVLFGLLAVSFGEDSREHLADDHRR